MRSRGSAQAQRLADIAELEIAEKPGLNRSGRAPGAARVAISGPDDELGAATLANWANARRRCLNLSLNQGRLPKLLTRVMDRACHMWSFPLVLSWHADDQIYREKELQISDLP